MSAFAPSAMNAYLMKEWLVVIIVKKYTASTVFHVRDVKFVATFYVGGVRIWKCVMPVGIHAVKTACMFVMAAIGIFVQRIVLKYIVAIVRAALSRTVRIVIMAKNIASLFAGNARWNIALNANWMMSRQMG